MHAWCALLRFWVFCRRGVDTRYGLSLRLNNSVAWATTAVACFHGKCAANWRAKFVRCHVHWWCLLYESVRSTYQTSERWSDVNAKSQGMYAIFDLTRRYGNENGNGRSAASGTLGKFWANKGQGFTFCVTVDANWIVCRPKQIRLLVEHF